jgi:hypothetical protein
MESKPAKSHDDQETEYRRDNKEDEEALVRALTQHDQPCMSY